MTKALALRSPGTQLLTLFFLLAFSGGLFAQATLSVQGVLTKSDGTAVDDGQYPITFRLWTAESGGNMVHEETIQQVETTGGVYSALLGANGFNANATFSQVYYLGVSVNGGAELAPRPRLTHAPYTLSVIGSSNKFTSSGPVEADGYKANNGTPAIGVAGTGYSFRGNGSNSDQDGGLFSYADDQVSLYTNAQERIKVTGGQTEVKNPFYGYGKVHSNSGFFLHNNGSSTDVGMYSPNGSSVGLYTGSGVDRIIAFSDGNNYYKTTGSHVFQTGNVQMDNNLTVNSNIVSGGGSVGGFVKARAGNLPNTSTQAGGFTFYTSGGTDDTDSGMFSPYDGEVHLRTNGNTRILIGSNGTTYFNGDMVYQNSPGAGSGGSNTARIRISDGLIFRETSSRRYKINIRPLADDFRKILLVQPKIYNRPSDPKEDELGYIAEELDSIGLQSIVIYRPDGLPEGVNYEKMGLYTVEIVKTHEAIITKMQAELDALKKAKSDLTAENTVLKNQQAAFSAQLEALSKRMNSLENTGATGMRK